MKYLLAVVLLLTQLSLYAGFKISDISEKWEKYVSKEKKEEVKESVVNVLQECNENVSKEWSNLCEVMEKVFALVEELPSLPESSMLKKDQNSQKKKIKKLLKEAETILLPKKSQKRLKSYKEFDKAINKCQNEINNLVEDSVVNQQNIKKNEKKIEKLKCEVVLLKEQQKNQKIKILEELNELGLNIPKESLESFFSSVTCESLIDYSIVTANITIVVKNLEELTQKNLNDAKRYYSMYLVMVDLQILCHEEFVSKFDNIWIKEIDSLQNKTMKDYEETIKLSENIQFSYDQRFRFKENAKLNKITLETISLYRKCLENHRQMITNRLFQLGKMRSVANNTYQTINNAGSLKLIMDEYIKDFSSVINLDFPDIKGMSEDVLVNEFRKITEKIQ